MLVKGGFAQAASPFRQAALSGALLRPAAIMAALTGCAVLVRLPFLSDAGTDESFYLVVARQWLEGMPPYANALDVKPPLLFALMAGAEALFGPSLLAAKALTMAAVSATACALYLFGRRFIGELSGVAASLFYIAASLTLSGALSPAELIMAPFTAFGMLAGFAGLAKERPRLWPLAGAGVLFGAAACVKQTAIFEALPLAAFLVLRRPPDDAFKALASFALGCIVVPAGFGLFFLAEGHFGALFDNVVMSVAGRMSAGYVSWSEAFVRFGIELMLASPLVILGTAAWFFRGALRGGTARPAARFLGAWAAGALAGVLAGKAMCDFYMLAALPPFCLLSGVFLEHGIAHSRAKRMLRLARAAAFASVMIFFVTVMCCLSYATADSTAADEAAAVMRSAGLRKGDRILVVDRDLSVYLASGANPAAPIFHPLQLLCDFIFKDAATALADSLKSRPAFVVVADPAYTLGCEKPERRALLKWTLADDYRLAGRFGSMRGRGREAGAFALYGRKTFARDHAPNHLKSG
jgi:4-amino-4-deoxy-L-arabinose transferase-like glycosyltransferase